MNIALLAFDLDGTTITQHQYLPQENRLALEDAAAQGILLVPASGRMKDFLPREIISLPGVRYAITANGAGMDALGQVNITVDYNGRVFHGMGLSTDVIESAALALLHAINNIERTKRIQELREPPKKIDDLVAEHKA